MSDERAADLTGRIDRRGFLVTGSRAMAATSALADGRPAVAQAVASDDPKGRATPADPGPHRRQGRASSTSVPG